MWATRRRPVPAEPTVTVRLPWLASSNDAREGAALRMAARTCPSWPATPPTEDSARISAATSSTWPAPAKPVPHHAAASSAMPIMNTRRLIQRSGGVSRRSPVDRVRHHTPGRAHGTLGASPGNPWGRGRRLVPSTRSGAGGQWRFDPARMLWRVGLALTLVMAGVVKLAGIDANWRFAELATAAPATALSAPVLPGGRAAA